MRQYTVKLPAGGEEELAVVGDYVRLSGGGVNVRVTAPDTGEFAEIEPGDAVTLTPFRRLRLRHASAQDQTVTLMVGQGTRVHSAKIAGIPATGGPFSSVVALPGAAAMDALPANPSRRYLMLINQSTVDAFVRVDGVDANAGIGSIPLPPGAVLEYQGYCPTDKVSVIEAAAGAVILCIAG